eukprot:TRINITY_DN10381_c0_g1_i1.p1 TRINITY_DN10381_c0_g1~~TRINITY_DN10381_c0_g1_i1.p1  ORF type:complete len:364 (-),score=67.23 TRINITY_DN10381_c0_g1_i1:293-1384(-)
MIGCSVTAWILKRLSLTICDSRSRLLLLPLNLSSLLLRLSLMILPLLLMSWPAMRKRKSLFPPAPHSIPLLTAPAPTATVAVKTASNEYPLKDATPPPVVAAADDAMDVDPQKSVPEPPVEQPTPPYQPNPPMEPPISDHQVNVHTGAISILQQVADGPVVGSVPPVTEADMAIDSDDEYHKHGKKRKRNSLDMAPDDADGSAAPPFLASPPGEISSDISYDSSYDHDGLDAALVSDAEGQSWVDIYRSNIDRIQADWNAEPNRTAFDSKLDFMVRDCIRFLVENPSAARRSYLAATENADTVAQLALPSDPPGTLLNGSVIPREHLVVATVKKIVPSLGKTRGRKARKTKEESTPSSSVDGK